MSDKTKEDVECQDISKIIEEALKANPDGIIVGGEIRGDEIKTALEIAESTSGGSWVSCLADNKEEI